MIQGDFDSTTFLKPSSSACSDGPFCTFRLNMIHVIYESLIHLYVGVVKGVAHSTPSI